jgi:hypothetical protein
MEENKRKKLEESGWTIGDIQDFLGLSNVEMKIINENIIRNHEKSKQELSEEIATKSITSENMMRIGNRFVDMTFYENWKDISSEEYRTYDFSDGGSITIKKPLRIKVSENGHRILDADGVSHYVPKGWIHLYWEGDPPFVF